MQSFINFPDRMHRTCNLEKFCLFNGYCYGLTELNLLAKVDNEWMMLLDKDLVKLDCSCIIMFEERIL